ncbi:MAG: acetyl-CoA C-acetyltransferase [Planctomycetota bacterium]|nr:acetyl-CoA C-acetyltransferase [Planctomycetota bacterium]
MSTFTSPHARPIVVTHALRTPIGRFLGSLSSMSGVDLGVSVVKDLLGRADLDPAEVGSTILGMGRQAGSGPNPARQVAVRAGIPVTSPAWTMNMACASGLKTVNLAADWISLGRAEVMVVGGMESMSQLPHMLPNMRQGYRLGHAKVVDGMYKDGFDCPLAEMVMGGTAENLAKKHNITREEQDAFAMASQHKSQAARESGHTEVELSHVTVPGRKGDTIFTADEHVRDDVTMESLAKLPTVFDREAGSVTPGNASGITDGAAAMLVMSLDKANALGLEPLAYVGHMSEAGVDPTIMGIGPVPAIQAIQAQSGLGVDDYDLIELNEAFAAQVLACDRELSLPMDRVNVNGGAISLGHPIGATGARIAVTLMHEMARRDAKTGLATLCVSGGMGIATTFHRP